MTVAPGRTRHITVRGQTSGHVVAVAPGLEEVPAKGGYWLASRRSRC